MNDRVFLLKALGLAGGLLVLLALADAGLRVAVERSGWLADAVDIQTPAILCAKLDWFRRFAGYKVALIGDSVVFGHSLAEHGDRLWRQHNLAPLLEERIRRQRPHDAVLVMNLGLNGALPADLDRMREFLTGCGPDLLVCDVGLRSFSADFTPPKARYSRPWLAEMSYVPGRPFAAPSEGREVEAAAARLALRCWSLLTYRDFVQYRWLDGPPRQAMINLRLRLNSLLGAAAPGDDEMVLLLQSQRRFQGINLAVDNPQRQALEHMLRALADARQKTLLFYTKEDPARIENLIDAPRYRALRAKLDGLIAGCTSADLVYLPPVDALRHEHYLDHTHLTYAGYQVLVEQMWPRLRPLVGDVQERAGSPPLLPGEGRGEGDAGGGIQP